MLDGLVSEETKDGSMMTTGMTPNPLSAFAMSSSSDAAASTAATIDIEKWQHCFNDDDDCEGEEGSPNNPIDVPMRISIPPSIPVHMGSSSSSTGVGLAVLPNPVIMSSSFSASSIDINTMRYCHVEVPSPLASPTYTCCDDVESKTTSIDNHSFPASSPSSPWPHSLTNAARSSSVGTSASTIHAMAKVLAGGSGNGDCGGAVDDNDVGEAACTGNNKDDVKADDRKGIATAAIRPDESYAAATFPSAEGFDAGSAMMTMPNNPHPGTDCNNDQAAIFDENHRSQPEKPQDQHHPQQQQQGQQQDGAQQRARIQSSASPPPPSTDMVRSFSFPAVGGGAAYGSIMMSGAHSSSGSLYSEHTAMSQSETDSPSNENSWRNASNGNPDANIAKALTTEGDGGGNKGTTETQHHVMSDSSVPAMPRAQVHFRKNYTTTSSISITEPVPSSSSALQAPHHPPADKRQKRLERNRESARVSRRRRKFYLEELECKVTKLSEEMDRGRMKHACAALPSLRNARAAVLNDMERCIAVYPITTTTPNPLSTIHHNITTVVPSPGPNNALQQQHRHYPATVHNVDGATPLFAQQLSRTNDELQIVQIFMKQQLASLVQPILTKFVLWLSLQNEEYYRGGRSASERLSAARIGERLLHRGTRRAAPESGLMWPLICHEISLSYEQEEKVRTVQRLILSNVDSWIQRHTALATRNVMESIHEVISRGHAAAKSRERNVMELLTPEQRVIFLVWARRNGEVIRRLAEAKVRSGAVVSRRLWMDTGRGAAIGAGGEMTLECGDNEYMTSPDRHVAANLYVINHLLSKIKQRQRQKCISATSNMFVHPMQLKKLSRRPSFESLAGLQAYEDSQISKKLSREASFPSTGSLKRSLNDMSLEGSHSDLHSINSFQDATMNGITPVSAQSAGQAAVLAVLSDVMPIVPKAAWINPLIMATSAVLPSGNIATGGTSMSVGTDVTHVTSQPPSQAFIPAPSVTHPPKRRHTDLQSPPTQQSVAKACNGGVGDYQHQHNHHHQRQEQPTHSDIPDADDIPMPTPVSVLLRTSDDYFSLFEPHEPSSTLGYDTSHHEIPFTTINNSTLLSSRHRSAPQLATFSRWGSSSAHPTLQTAHMAVIPESEPVSVDVGVDFFTPDQLNAVPHVTNTDSILGNSHQSAPQLYAEQSPTFLSGSLITNSAMMPQTNDVISPGNDQLIEEFARLEGLPLNMEADDWAIGEGFDMDF